MSFERAPIYNEKMFVELFKEYDEDGNGFLEKFEMVNFIKQIFKVP